MTNKTTDWFLPEGYEMKTSSWKYFKIQEWETIKVRILTNSVIWREYFKDVDWKAYPIRQQKKFNWTPADSKDGREPKEFRAFCIYNYETEGIQIWEITQSSIKKAIFNLWKDPDFGDPKNYDIKITREGKWLDTKYQIVPLNSWVFANKPVLDEVKTIRLEELFEGWDPFNPQPF